MAGGWIAVLGLLTLGGLLRAAVAAPAPLPCNDPCLQAARADLRTCLSSARGAFVDGLADCLELDRVCVDACRTQRQDCRDATAANADLDACAAALADAKGDCRTRFRIGSERHENCIDRAEVEAFRCRNEVRHRTRRAFLACREGFDGCVGACLPAPPPGDPRACRAAARAQLDAARAECRLVYQTTASGCVNRDVSCVQTCADAADTCAAPTQASLRQAILVCEVNELAALAACRTANPAGGSALDECVTQAQATAFTCRNAASKAAQPGFAACIQEYLGCVRACPKN